MEIPIYLDHHSTTPVATEVLNAMIPYFTHDFGNASSKDHLFGAKSAGAVEQARTHVANLLGCESEEVIFTSGATESDNLALVGAMAHYESKGDHLITVSTEHQAVLDTSRYLESLGKKVTYLSVDSEGRIDLDQLRDSITHRTVLVSVMAANNEIGVLAPLEEIGSICREMGVLFHTDATQAVGHISINVKAMKIDLLSCSAHKSYGPKGVGALYIGRRTPRVRISPLIRGGGHERGFRSGTLNVPGIVGFGEASRIAGRILSEESERVARLRDELQTRLLTSLSGSELNGSLVRRLPHNLNIWIQGIESKSLILRTPDLAFSAGAACTTEKIEPSHVIQALGHSATRAHQSIRIGLGRSTTAAEIDYAGSRLIEEVLRLRRIHT